MEATEGHPEAGTQWWTSSQTPVAGKPVSTATHRPCPRSRELLCTLGLDTKLNEPLPCLRGRVSEARTRCPPSCFLATNAQKPATVGPQRLQAKSLGPTAGVNHSLEACSEHPICVRLSLFPHVAWHMDGRQALGTEHWGQGLVGAARVDAVGIPAPTPRNEK